MSILKFLFALSFVAVFAADARALDLDWSGQFRAENHFISNYSLDSSDAGSLNDVTRSGAGGYYIPGGGQKSTSFQTLFLRLRPKVIVNDNVFIKSEFWAGNPIFGLFGNGAPGTTDQRQYYSTQSSGSVISAQRFWGEFLSDIGTVQVGRAPLNWGLGVVWNSGDDLWDRYQSTGDVIRLISKFGAFSFVPSIIKYSLGNTIGGACNAGATGCLTVPGSGGVSDYSLAFKYENPDEDFEAGVNFVKRLAGAAQDPTNGFLGVEGVPAGLNYNTWDLYGRKKFGRISLGAEVPIISGRIGRSDYSAVAAAAEAKWQISDSWDASLRGGYAPGTGGDPANYKAFYFHPNYRLGLIMFNYQLANFAGPQANAGGANSSPFGESIVNANYLAASLGWKLEKWRVHTGFIYALANESAQAGSQFYNTRQRKYVANVSGRDQGKSLGSEIDLGMAYQYDDSFQFRLDTGIFLPGDFFKFANLAGVENAISAPIAIQLGVGANF